MPFVVKCPGCKQRIKWLVDDPPDDCPACGHRLVSDRADSDVVMPNILAFSTRCQDGVYKAMEKASEQRVYEAAEMAGCSPSEMSGLKITNLRDNMKQGEIAAMPVVNDVTRHMDRLRAMNPNAQVGYGADASAGAEYAAGAASGRIADGVPGSILPRRGAQVLSAVKGSHAGKQDAMLQESRNRGF
jgi:hypothetical protein